MRADQEGRAIAVSALLRQGWSAKAVQAGLAESDAGHGPEAAMAAMKAVRDREEQERGDDRARRSGLWIPSSA